MLTKHKNKTEKNITRLLQLETMIRLAIDMVTLVENHD